MVDYQVMPPLSAEDFDRLKSDISARGVQVPVEYDEDGNVLDGFHRVRACTELGRTDWPRLVRNGMTEAEKRTHARQLNIARRHLSSEQIRVLVLAEVVDAPEKSDRQIAAGLGVSHTTVAGVRAEAEAGGQIGHQEKTVGKDGVTQPRARRSQLKGDKKRPITTTYIDPTPAGKKAALKQAKDIRSEAIQEGRAKRLAKIAEINAGNAELGTAVRYPVIYADPPWRYENPPIGATSRAIENHYPTMTLAEICAMPVRELAAEDAILYLWATAPKLAECMEVVKAWGFEYRTNMVWDKEKIGMGYHARNQHELLLIATRGDIPPPQAGTQFPSVYRAPRRAHSEKPKFFAKMIEGYYPGLQKIELFARSPRTGWSVWGNQSAGTS